MGDVESGSEETHPKVTKHTLARMYLIKKLSTRQIALHTGISHGYVHKLLRKHSIPLRGHQEARPIPQSCNVRSPQFHYLQGVLHGDGTVSKYVFQLRSTDLEFNEKFSQCLYELGFNPKTKAIKSVSKKQTFNSYVCSMNLCNLLKETEPVINDNFINGLIDSEATVGSYGNSVKVIKIAMTNHKLLKSLERAFRRLSIKTHLYKKIQPRNSFKPDNIIYSLEILDMKSIKKFSSKFNFSINSKREKLNNTLHSFGVERGGDLEVTDSEKQEEQTHPDNTKRTINLQNVSFEVDRRTGCASTPDSRW